MDKERLKVGIETQDGTRLVLLAYSLSLLLMMVVGGLLASFLARDAPVYQATPDQSSDQLPFSPVLEQISGRYLLSGTVVWDRGVEDSATDQYGAVDISHPFKGLDTYNPQQYNAWVADLECPTSAEDVPRELGIETFEFNCRPEFLSEAVKYFDILNLSNNHSDNSGRDKLDETREALTYTGIQHYGDPEPSRSDDACEVVGLSVDGIMNDGSTENSWLPVAFCAWHYFYRLPLPGEIEAMQKYAEVMPVFAFLHMGAEYRAESTQSQRDTARSIIDSGADFVIANNPHWVQEAESYKGKLIVYSTGNFIFDQKRDEEVSRNVSIDVSVSAAASLDLDQWLQMGQSCMLYKDSCLQRAIDMNLGRVELDYIFRPIAGDVSGDYSLKGNADLQAQVEERLNWAEVSRKLTY